MKGIGWGFATPAGIVPQTGAIPASHLPASYFIQAAKGTLTY
jgi:hypothetical protein